MVEKETFFMTTAVVAISFNGATYEIFRHEILGRVIVTKEMMHTR